MRNLKLAAGIVAGPLFIGTALIQAFTRDGFDLSRHPISLLSLGDHGWIQVVNFVVSGVLFVVYAAGIREALPTSTWAPRLVGAQGIGVVIAGVFVTDPGAGFPAGAPRGRPEQISWHGVLHEAGFTLALIAWIACCFVFRRHITAAKRLSIAAPIAAIAVAAWPDLDSLSVRLVISTAIQFGFLAVIAIRLGGVVEDQTEGVPGPRPDRADAVADR